MAYRVLRMSTGRGFVLCYVWYVGSLPRGSREGALTMFGKPVLPAFALVVASGLTAACASHGTSAETAAAPRNVVTAQTIADNANEPIEKILADRIAGVRLGV